VITYQVQGRRTERDPDGTVHNVVRLESAPNRHSAFELAETMTADRLTVWVFKAERRAGKLSYELLGVVSATAS
jgi:hypothetical protein